MRIGPFVFTTWNTMVFTAEQLGMIVGEKNMPALVLYARLLGSQSRIEDLLEIRNTIEKEKE